MHSDKPINLSVKDYIIRRLATKLRKSEDVIALIISHQFASGNKATHEHNQIEFSGLGKFVYSHNKANKRLQKYNTILSRLEAKSEEFPDNELYKTKIFNTKEDIKFLEKKNQCQN